MTWLVQKRPRAVGSSRQREARGRTMGRRGKWRFSHGRRETPFSLPFGDLTLTWNCSSYERSKHRGGTLEPRKAEVRWLLGTPGTVTRHFLLCEMESSHDAALESWLFWDLTVEESYNLDSLVLYLTPHVPAEQLNLRGICIIYSFSGREQVASRSVLGTPCGL